MRDWEKDLTIFRKLMRIGQQRFAGPFLNCGKKKEMVKVWDCFGNGNSAATRSLVVQGIMKRKHALGILARWGTVSRTETQYNRRLKLAARRR
jgi:hypothetical protein